jgi:hypothetical protein
LPLLSPFTFIPAPSLLQLFFNFFRLFDPLTLLLLRYFLLPSLSFDRTTVIPLGLTNTMQPVFTWQLLPLLVLAIVGVILSIIAPSTAAPAPAHPPPSMPPMALAARGDFDGTNLDTDFGFPKCPDQPYIRPGEGLGTPCTRNPDT